MPKTPLLCKKLGYTGKWKEGRPNGRLYPQIQRREGKEEIHHILTSVYTALEEKGYNPINQLVGYILSEDPTYITNHRQARTLIRKLDRDELLQVLLRSYLSQ